MNTTKQETLRAINNLSEKELYALYKAACPVKSPTNNQYEALRREMIRRGFLISA